MIITIAITIVPAFRFSEPNYATRDCHVLWHNYGR
jgi:hypothetical protein